MYDLRYYINMFPAWMKEDVKFLDFYSCVARLFAEVQETKEQILGAFLFANENNTAQPILNYPTNIDSLASYYGINRNFYTSSGVKVKSKNLNGSYTTEETLKEVNIQMSDKNLFRLIKFKILKNSFDGTIKNLIKNYNSLFYKEIEDKEMIISFKEDIYTKDASDPNSLKLPKLVIDLTLPINNGIMPLEEQNEVELFLNRAYDFSYLGVIIQYTVNGKSVEVIWDQSNWDDAIWKL